MESDSEFILITCSDFQYYHKKVNSKFYILF